MIVPDINLLLYAVIDGFPEHDRARAWWQDALNHEEVGIAAPALFGFLRVATNPRVFDRPMSIESALAAIAIEHQADLSSNDSDFARFEGLRWLNPLA